MPRSPTSIRWLAIAGVSATLLATRLPLLLTDASYADGDECLLWLMVFHVLRGDGFPVFPYGAQFGVSFPETAIASAWSAVFGLSETNLRVAQLLLWTTVAGFLGMSVRRIHGGAAGLLAGLLIVVTPAWFHASVASWGYYHSGFLAAHAGAFFVALLVTGTGRPWTCRVGLGLCTALAWFSQPIFALALLPFHALLAVRRRDVREVLVLLAFVAAAGAAYGLFRFGTTQHWFPSLFAQTDPWSAALDLPRQFWVNATGAYFLKQTLRVGPLTAIAAAVWCASLAAAAWFAARRAIEHRTLTVGTACIGSIALVAGFGLLVDPGTYAYRYLLPCVGFQAMLLAIESGRLLEHARTRAAATSVCALLAVLSAGASVFETSRLSYSGSPAVGKMPEAAALAELTEYLEARDIRHVYSLGPMLQWKVMFVSRERIVARSFSPTDRVPAYPAAVNQAMAAGLPVALIGEARSAQTAKAKLVQLGFQDEPVFVADRYFVIERPSEPLVRYFFVATVSGKAGGPTVWRGARSVGAAVPSTPSRGSASHRRLSAARTPSATLLAWPRRRP